MKIDEVLEIAAGVIVRDDQVLICQRKEDTSHPMQWEFPGGKIEDGESPRDALRREMVEELAIDVNIDEELLDYEYTYSNGLTVHLTFFLISDFVPEPINLAFADIQWVAVGELDEYDFLDGDQSIINFLQYTFPESP